MAQKSKGCGNLVVYAAETTEHVTCVPGDAPDKAPGDCDGVFTQLGDEDGVLMMMRSPDN